MKGFHIGLRRLCSVLLGLVFFIAGMLKLMDPVGSGLVVEEYLEFFHIGGLAFAAKWIGVILALVETLTGAALIAGWVGLANYGGYLGMFDWDTVWPILTVIMKFGGYFGVAIVVIILLALPQIEYRMDPEGYFLITEDYDAYVEHMEAKKG